MSHSSYNNKRVTSEKLRLNSRCILWITTVIQKSQTPLQYGQ